MAEESKITLEREYVIPLRREFIKKPYYKRARRAAITVKQFIAKHMKVPERDLDKVKLDVYLNNEIWARGKSNPPAKVKVKATKKGDIVYVTFAEIPQSVKFAKAKSEKRHSSSEKSKEKPAEAKPEEGTKTEAQKKDEAEKEKSTEIQHTKEIKQEITAEKHTTPVKETGFNRTSMDRH
jgi:large subunit ribosomal protein L31e